MKIKRPKWSKHSNALAGVAMGECHKCFKKLIKMCIDGSKERNDLNCESKVMTPQS